jgi:acetyl-CoA carboxylase beta subunit
MIQDRLVTIIQGGKKEYLTCFDLKNKQFACTCDAFNATAEKERVRHLICKHLFRTIYHHYEAFTPLKINNPWNESLKEIEKTVNQKDKSVLLTNWLYYFTRHVFAKLEFKATTFKAVKSAEEAIATLNMCRKN